MNLWNRFVRGRMMMTTREMEIEESSVRVTAAHIIITNIARIIVIMII